MPTTERDNANSTEAPARGPLCSTGGVAIHARVPREHIDEIDLAASAQTIPVSRSRMVAYIIAEWRKRRRACVAKE